ncbi:MAG: hypothetical protein GWN86_05185, partial [Desulfobacterales bacterium]|nr:hypothetical protein [Desulfobacterales bacterium]
MKGKRRLNGKETGLTRRELLGGVGKLALGTALVTAGGGLLSTGASAAKGENGLPWGYKKIDPRKAAAIAYENW